MKVGDKDFLIDFLNVSDHDDRAFLITIATAFLRECTLEDRKNFFRKLVDVLGTATEAEYQSTFFAMKLLIEEMRREKDMKDTLLLLRVELDFSLFRSNSPQHFRDIKKLRAELSLKLGLARNRIAA